MSSSTTTGPPFRAALELLRLPNVFTAISNVWMGFLFAHDGGSSWSIALVLVASSCCLYLAGMVLNDLFDVEVDRRERPGRPLPSGRLSLRTARFLGVELLLVGIALGWTASYWAQSWRPGGVATGLAALVVLYDAWAKNTPLGPLAMGGCRGLNILLGMSTAAAWQPAQLVVAGGVALYIVGVTWFARTEAVTSRRRALALGLATMLAGLALAGAFPLAPGAPPLVVRPTTVWWTLWAFLAAANLWRAARAILEPTPQFVQQAVGRSIVALIPYDAAIVLAIAGGPHAAALLLLLVPTLWLGRWIYHT